MTNTVTVVGNLTRDPELRFTPNGQATVAFGLAVNRRWQGLTTPDDVRACVRHVGALPPLQGERYAVGVDLGVKDDATVAAVCHTERHPHATMVVLDRLQVWTPRPGSPVNLTEVEEWLLEAHRSYGRPAVVLDPWQALAMAQRLRSRRVKVIEFTFNQSTVGRLALTLYRLLRDRLLDLPDDDELLDELASVRLRETSPGVFRLDHDAGRHDDRAIALALAAEHLLNRPARRGRSGTFDYITGEAVSVGSGTKRRAAALGLLDDDD